MSARPLRIAIVGCGTAGPAAAVLLRRQGHEVVLFERAEECKAVGAGFLLQPSGMEVLEELGILADVLVHAAKVDRLHVLDSAGDTLLDLNYREVGQGSFGAGLHRPVLLHHLLKAMDAATVDVRWGWEIEEVSRSGNQWRLRSADGKECDGFDLLVVADGAR
ncbi:MAG: FAD-dependent oxidoreductase, partial [Luteolibacter sp.]